MKAQSSHSTFVAQIELQLRYLRKPDYSYDSLQIYIAGIGEPWEFTADDEFEFHEETGVLIVRNGPTDEDGNNNATVPEYVFRLEHIVASKLI